MDGFDHSDALLAVTNRRRRLDYSMSSSSSSDSSSIINTNQHVDSRYSDNSNSASNSGDTLSTLGSGSVVSGASTTDSEMGITFPTTTTVGPREYLLYNFYYNPDDGESVADSFYGSGTRVLPDVYTHSLSVHISPSTQATLSTYLFDPFSPYIPSS